MLDTARSQDAYFKPIKDELTHKHALDCQVICFYFSADFMLLFPFLDL